jgi:hypothetical protein
MNAVLSFRGLPYSVDGEVHSFLFLLNFTSRDLFINV